MKIAIMMRAMDQDSGFRGYVEGLVESMLQIDEENTYLLFYRRTKWMGRFSSYKNAKEILINAPHKFLWDQVAVPHRAWKEKADVIFNPKFSVPLISHCPVAMGLQEPAWWTHPDHYEWFDAHYMRTMLPLYCRKSSHLFPMSNFILEENRKVLGMALENVTVTYTAPGKHFFPIRDQEVLAEFREKYKLPENFILGVTRVLHPGLDRSNSFHSTKNPETTLRAFLLCRGAIKQKLVLAGRRVPDYLLYKGFMSSDFEGVTFIDFVPYEELPKLYNTADLFITPALYDGSPANVMEAMACGIPVIASNIGGAEDVGRGAAILADPHNPADYAEKIKRVLNDENLRKEMVKTGFQRAESFKWETTARLTLEGLKQAAQGR